MEQKQDVRTSHIKLIIYTDFPFVSFTLLVNLGFIYNLFKKGTGINEYLYMFTISRHWTSSYHYVD